MDEILKNQFKKRIEVRKESSFQKFCQDLLLKKFGQDFQVVKDKRDKGCDGILNQDTIISIYSPEKENLRSFKLKVKEDFEKYQKNWKQNYKKWCFVYNGELTAERIGVLDEASQDCMRWDINQILEMIDALSYYKMDQLAKSLNIDESLIIYNVLKRVIEDLTKDINITISDEKAPPYLPKKVKENYSQSEQEEALKEYEDNLQHILKLQEILKHFDDKHVASLKNKVRTIYNALGGSFKKKMDNLVKILSDDRKEDDLYVFYVRIIALYFFERCVLGKNPSEVKK